MFNVAIGPGSMLRLGQAQCGDWARCNVIGPGYALSLLQLQQYKIGDWLRSNVGIGPSSMNLLGQIMS